MQIAFSVMSFPISRHQKRSTAHPFFQKGWGTLAYHPTVNYESGILSSCLFFKLKNQENRRPHPPLRGGKYALNWIKADNIARATRATWAGLAANLVFAEALALGNEINSA
ncbi:MAG TPA: hypothetical protein VMI32_06660, partial [Candidatus Solibacter sp.]|nr:hypothetical protein [Candidatus Solibacter sp.]